MPTPTTQTDEELVRLIEEQIVNPEVHSDISTADIRVGMLSSTAVSDRARSILNLLKSHREEYAEQRVVRARLQQMDSHIGRLEVLRAWTVNHQPVFETGERMAAFTLHEIEDEIRIVNDWKAQLSPKDPNPKETREAT